MIGFAESFSVWLLATAIPAFLGLLAITWAATRARPRYAATFALGIFLWFFLDTIGGSANLDVNEGFTGGVAHVANVILFILGLLFFLWADRGVFNGQSANGIYGLGIALLTAVAIGIHGLAEGLAFGSTVSTTTSTSLIDAFGGLNAGIAYVLHKGLEPMMIGAVYSVYAVKQRTGVSGKIRDLLVLTLLFSTPSFLGAAAGYFLAIDATYFFALGTGTSIYVALRLAAPALYPLQALKGREAIKMSLTLLFGFLAIYVAALLHSWRTRTQPLQETRHAC